MIAREKWELPEAIFTILLIASVLAVKLPSWSPLEKYISEFSVGLQAGGIFLKEITISCFFLVLFTALAVLASGFPASKKWREHLVRVGPCYLYLAFAGFLNIYLHEFIYNGHNLLPWLIETAGLSDVIPVYLVTPNLGTLKALIPVITLSGSIASLCMLKAIANKHSLPVTVYRGHQAIVLLTSLIFLFIL
jgi:hypothetical protein